MASTKDLTSIVKISQENYNILESGGTLSGYSYDDSALYLVKVTDDDLYIAKSDIINLWTSGDTLSDYRVYKGAVYNADELKYGSMIIDPDKIKNGTLYI